MISPPQTRATAPARKRQALVGNPFWTVGRLAERTKVAFTTAQRAVDRLEAVGIVSLATERKRDRVYCARAILEILEEPSRVGTSRRTRRKGQPA